MQVEEQDDLQLLEGHLRCELDDISAANMKDIVDIKVDYTNVWNWNVLIAPSCVPYNKGAFWVEIKIPNAYPFRPPLILFRTKILHPNVDEEGLIHLEILTKYWSPSMQMEQVMRGLVAVVNKPEPHCPFHPEISRLSFKYSKNREEFIKAAIEMTEKFSEKRPVDAGRDAPKEVGLVADRLREELKEIQEAKMEGFRNIRVVDIWTWTGLVVPDCAPYNKGAFKFEIEIPPRYPQGPPEIFIRTRIYHPNVYDDGIVDMREICNEWKSSRTMIEVFRALHRLFSEPDVDHFFDSEAGKVYFKSREMFLINAEEFALQFAEKVTPGEFCSREGKCPSFERSTKEIVMAVNSITLEEEQRGSNTENTAMELSEEKSSVYCYEPLGKCLPFGDNSMTIEGEAEAIEISEMNISTETLKNDDSLA